MIWNAFLTGSRAYGTPRRDSDVDVVLRVSQDVIDALASALPENKIRRYPENDSISLWFDNLNLICITSDKSFETWLAGTLALKAKAPVTREMAIEEFEQRGITKSLESQTPKPKKVEVSADVDALPF